MKRPVSPHFRAYYTTCRQTRRRSEDRILIGRMEAGRRLYNAVSGEAQQCSKCLKDAPAWKKAKKIKDEGERSAGWKTLSVTFGFTAVVLVTYARVCKNVAGWQDRLGRNVAQRITEKAFVAVQQCAFGKKGPSRFKGSHRPLHFLEATNNVATILGAVIQTETLFCKSFQKHYGRSVKVRAPGMFVSQLRRKAESAAGKLIDVNTWSLKHSQYDPITKTYTKRPLGFRWPTVGKTVGALQRDIYSIFFGGMREGTPFTHPMLTKWW